MKKEELSQILWVSGSFFFRKRTLKEIKEAIGEHLLYICDDKEIKIEYFENDENKIFINKFEEYCREKNFTFIIKK